MSDSHEPGPDPSDLDVWVTRGHRAAIRRACFAVALAFAASVVVLAGSLTARAMVKDASSSAPTTEHAAPLSSSAVSTSSSADRMSSISDPPQADEVEAPEDWGVAPAPPAPPINIDVDDAKSPNGGFDVTLNWDTPAPGSGGPVTGFDIEVDGRPLGLSLAATERSTNFYVDRMVTIVVVAVGPGGRSPSAAVIAPTSVEDPAGADEQPPADLEQQLPASSSEVLTPPDPSEALTSPDAQPSEPASPTT